MSTFHTLLLSVGSPVLVGIFMYFLLRPLRKKEKQEAEKEKAYKRERKANINALLSLMFCSSVTIVAIKKGKINGEIDQVRLYLGPLTQDEIDGLYNAGAGR